MPIGETGAFGGLTSAISVSVWFDWDDPATIPDENNQLFGAHGGPGAAYDPIFDVERGWIDKKLWLWDASNETSYNPIPDEWFGRWNHYAFVKDVIAESLKIYINSELVSAGDSNSPTVIITMVSRQLSRPECAVFPGSDFNVIWSVMQWRTCRRSR